MEVPAGRVDEGEAIEDAAAREVLEETGWRPGPVTPLLTFHPANGMSDITFHLYLAAGATYVGEPADAFESERVEWVPVSRLRQLLAAGEALDGMTVAGLSLALALGKIS